MSYFTHKINTLEKIYFTVTHLLFFNIQNTNLKKRISLIKSEKIDDDFSKAVIPYGKN